MGKTDLRVVLGVDGDAEFSAKMSKLEKQQKEITSSIKSATTALGSSASQYDKAKASVDGLSEKISLQKEKVNTLKDAYEKSKAELGENANATIELKTKMQNAEATLNSMKNQLTDYNKVITDSKEKTREAGENLKEFGIVAEKVGEKSQKVGNKMSKYLTTSIMAAGTYAAKAAIDYETAFAGVTKTVDGTEKQLEKLSDTILDMSTKLPASANEIAGVAEAAGQLGIQVDDIGAFTEVMVELGMSTNLNANEAASSLAKLANITKMSSDDYEKLGSTIVDLGNNFATTENDIVSMAMRVAATGETVGYTEPQILAVSTALSSVGIEAEAGGSAISKLMKKLELSVKTNESATQVIKKTGMSLRDLELLSTNNSMEFKDLAQSIGMTSTELNNMISNNKSLQQFAEVSGKTVDEFINAYGVDAVSALGSFIDGLRDTQKTGKSAVEVLQDMGLTEVRLSNAVLALSSAENILGRSIETANNAWDENSALQTEVSKRLDTTASKMTTAKNELTKTAVILGDNFLPTIANIAKEVGELAKRFGELPQRQQETIAKFALIVAAAGPAISIFGKLSSGVGSTMTNLSKLVKVTKDIKAGTYTGPLKNIVGLLGQSSSETANLTAKSTGLAGVFGASGPLLIGFAAAAAAGTALYLAYRSATKESRELTEQIKELCSEFGDFDTDVENATNLLSGLNKEILVSSEKEREVSDSMDIVQKKITEIATLAATERRSLTQDEIDRLKDLFNQMNELCNAELEFYTAYQTAVERMADAETNYTKERALDLIKTAEDTKNSVLQKAEEQYVNKLILAQKAYEDEGTLTKEAYDKQVENAKNEYDVAVNSVTAKYADTYSIITNGYYEQNIAHDEQLKKILQLNDDMVKENKNYITKQTEIESDWKLTEDQRRALKVEAEMAHKDKIKEIQSEMVESFKDMDKEQLATWIEMSANCESYGGEISDEAQETADKFINSFDNMPKKAKKAFKETMQGMLDGISEKSGELFKKATEIAGGFINKIRAKFDSHSPSRVMKKLFKDVVKGGEIGTDDEKPNLIKSAADLSEDFIAQFDGMNFSPEITAKLKNSSEKFFNSDFGSRLRSAHDVVSTIAQKKESYINNNSTINNNHSQKFDTLFKVENLTVRSDDDIRKISQQIEALAKSVLLGKGVKQ